MVTHVEVNIVDLAQWTTFTLIFSTICTHTSLN